MIAAKVTGYGEPILLLHGLFGDKDNLRSVASYLQKDFNVHSLDLPNHGDAAHIDTMDFENFSQSIQTYVDSTFPQSQTLRLLGHSLGGKTFMRYACQNPNRVKQLVVVDIAPKVNENRFQAILAGLKAINPNRVESRKDANEQLSEYIPTPSVRQFLLKSLARVDQGFQWKFNLPAILSHEHQWLASGLEPHHHFLGQTHFIKGEKSDYIIPEDWSTIIEHFPTATLHTVEGADHWVHAEQPKRFKACLQALLAS